MKGAGHPVNKERILVGNHQSNCRSSNGNVTKRGTGNKAIFEVARGGWRRPEVGGRSVVRTATATTAREKAQQSHLYEKRPLQYRFDFGGGGAANTATDAAENAAEGKRAAKYWVVGGAGGRSNHPVTVVDRAKDCEAVLELHYAHPKPPPPPPPPPPPLPVELGVVKGRSFVQEVVRKCSPTSVAGQPPLRDCTREVPAFPPAEAPTGREPTLPQARFRGEKKTKNLDNPLPWYKTCIS